MRAGSVARERSPRTFALDATAEVAAARAAAFDVLAAEWEGTQAQARDRETTSSALRALVAAAAYAASGGSILAPFLSVTVAYPESLIAVIVRGRA